MGTAVTLASGARPTCCKSLQSTAHAARSSSGNGDGHFMQGVSRALRFVGIVLVASQMAASSKCGGPSSPSVPLPCLPVLLGPTNLTIGQPPATYTLAFCVPPSSRTQLATASLVEAPTGTNTGGLFAWEQPAVAPNQTELHLTFQLACPGNSVVGIGATNGPPSYRCPGNPPPAGNGCPNVGAGPCACVKQDNTTPSNPDSNLGGLTIFGNRQSALVRADISLDVQGDTIASSNTLAVNCLAASP
jgi:hypothetical protein